MLPSVETEEVWRGGSEGSGSEGASPLPTAPTGVAIATANEPGRGGTGAPASTGSALWGAMPPPPPPLLRLKRVEERSIAPSTSCGIAPSG